MIFALGFLFAGLVALAFAPAFWRRANRLTRRRLEMQVPLSVQEILAERDQLRAEFAVEQRRLEIRSEQTKRAHAADRGELGRRAVEISDLNERLAQSTQQNREYERMLAQSQSQLAAASAELGALSKALYDAEGLHERKAEEYATLFKAHETMTALAQERLANHAAADARAAGFELRLGDVSRMLLEAERQFTERTAHAARLNDALALSNRNLEQNEANYGALQKKLDLEVARTTQLTAELETIRRQSDEDQGKLRSLTIKVGLNETALEDAARREKKIRGQRDQQAERSRVAEHALIEKLDRLQSEHAGLQGALDVARRRCEALEAELSAQRPGRQREPAASEFDGVLRQDREPGTIVRLPRVGTESSLNGGASKNSTEEETSAPPIVPSPPPSSDAPPADELEIRDEVGT